MFLERMNAQTETLATPSGKHQGNENFPVGSFLIRPDLRVHVHAFYRFARMGDDIADNPDLSGAEKIRRLDRMAQAVDGAEVPEAEPAMGLHRSLRAVGVSPVHCHELLDAFRLDATKTRYQDWSDLLAYCRLSAATVGRHVLDLHGEDRANWAASDALCVSLQILNHLQDCGDDRREMDRVYIPQDMLAENGCSVADLDADRASPGLMQVLASMVERTAGLMATGRMLPVTVRDRRLRGEVAAISHLALSMTDRLRGADPLAHRIKPTKLDFFRALSVGLSRAVFGGGAYA
jgi:squalene synthase HpnC